VRHDQESKLRPWLCIHSLEERLDQRPGPWTEQLGNAGRKLGSNQADFPERDLTGQSLPDSMRWRGEALKTKQDQFAQ
jgi:hypothetical protein